MCYINDRYFSNTVAIYENLSILQQKFFYFLESRQGFSDRLHNPKSSDAFPAVISATDSMLTSFLPERNAAISGI